MISGSYLKVKGKDKTIEELNGKNTELLLEVQECKTGVGQPSISSLSELSFENRRLICGSSVSRTEIARDESNRPTQTVETAFVPCEGCHRLV